MNRLEKVSVIVKLILEQDEKTRNSDSYLYFKVINYIACRHKIDLRNVTMQDFLLSLGKNSPFPPFESVRRTRAKVQEKNPHLRACEKVQGYRAENELIFEEYARD